MKAAIMQPYFMPYIGYFQLIHAVDLFVVYDNIKYTKKGWINRNRFLLNGSDAVFSIPLKKGAEALDVCERSLAEDFAKVKLLNQIREAYRKAPHFHEGISLFERIVSCPETNLFKYIYHSLFEVCRYLDIKTKMIVSSTIEIDHGLRSQEKVVTICKAIKSDTYVNPIGGIELYSKESFAAEKIDLKFIKTKPMDYKQFGNEFVPWLSILDVIMFNPKEQVQKMISEGYELT